MANEIRDAFAAAWPDGPTSDPVEPDKYVIRSIGPTIDTKIANTASGLQTQINEVELIAEAASVGLVQKGTWAQLSAIAGSANGQAGRVAGPDAGTHTDPVVGGTVANEGEYAWSTSPAGWQRVGELLVSKVAQVAASFHDNLGFVGMQLQTDGSLRQNPPERSFEICDTRSADELLAVQDDRGFKALSLTATEFRAPGVSGGEDEGFNYGFDASPLIGGHLVAFDGAETHIYARNILPARSDISRVRASLYSEAATDGSRPSYSRLGDDELVVDLTNCGGTVYLQTRLDEVNPDIRHQATLSVITPPVAPGSLNIARVLMIGDSITNRQMAARMNAAAAAKGYTLTFVGTLNGAGIGQISSDVTGPLGEGREGWEFGDFTYAVTDRVSIVAPGDEATYLASDKATKQTKNPFLRVAAGGDDQSVVRNGNVFDFDFYLDRFTLADPHVYSSALAPTISAISIHRISGRRSPMGSPSCAGRFKLRGRERRSSSGSPRFHAQVTEIQCGANTSRCCRARLNLSAIRQT